MSLKIKRPLVDVPQAYELITIDQVSNAKIKGRSRISLSSIKPLIAEKIRIRPVKNRGERIALKISLFGCKLGKTSRAARIPQPAQNNTFFQNQTLILGKYFSQKIFFRFQFFLKNKIQLSSVVSQCSPFSSRSWLWSSSGKIQSLEVVELVTQVIQINI